MQCVLSQRQRAIQGFTKEMARLFNEAETSDDLWLAQYLERRITAFENMTDEEFEEELDV